MAVYRPVPTCSYCGKETATGKYKDQSKTPPMLRIIGDTFLGWDYKECNCKEAKKARKELKKDMEKFHKEHPFDLEKAFGIKTKKKNK